MASLEHYAAMFQGVPAIFAGDLNSSASVGKQQQSHPVFVERARSHGLVSAYHSKTGEAHGQETIGTYCHRGSKSSMFHLDYCFVSSAMAGDVSIDILTGEEWMRQSDHFPVVLDVADSALKAQQGAALN